MKFTAKITIACASVALIASVATIGTANAAVPGGESNSVYVTPSGLTKGQRDRAKLRYWNIQNRQRGVDQRTSKRGLENNRKKAQRQKKFAEARERAARKKK